MPIYKYTALDKKKQKVTGAMDCKSEVDLKKKLRSKGLNVTSIKEGSAGDLKKAKKKSKFFAKVSFKEIGVFTRQLATMLTSGVTLLRGVTVLAQQNENPLFAEILTDIKDEVTSGKAFSTALAKYPKYFDHLYVNMVKAGEASGGLDNVLERIATSLEKTEEMKGQVKSALVYPLIIVFVAVLVVFFMLAAVIPKFMLLFDGSGVPLPTLTRLVMLASDIAAKYWYVVVGLNGLFFYGFKKFVSTENGRLAFDRFVLKVPIFGKLVEKIAVARFTRTMSTLLNSGVPILGAFDIVAEIVGNKVIEGGLKVVKEHVSEGANIAQPLAKVGIFPPMVVDMVAIGEESGELAKLLGKVADFNERELEEAIRDMLAALEPMIIFFIAIVVGVLIVAMFLPLFSLSDAIT